MACQTFDEYETEIIKYDLKKYVLAVMILVLLKL